jgi:hypothetical protein
MSKILEKATSHFRAKISGDMQKVHVPEWECDIYFKPTLNLKEQGKLIELASQGKQVEALVESLIIKARNADGTRMFNIADKATMLNEVDPAVLIRVVGEINNQTEVETDMGKVEKN